VAAVVMDHPGVFFFAAVSGNLVGMIGSSNNPVSGLTLSDAHRGGAAHGFHRRVGQFRCGGGAGVAAGVCVSSAVAGENVAEQN